MKIYHNGNQIFYAVYNKDLFNFTHTTNVPLSVLEIDETEANKELCLELYRTRGFRETEEGIEQVYSVVKGNLLKGKTVVTVEKDETGKLVEAKLKEMAIKELQKDGVLTA